MIHNLLANYPFIRYLEVRAVAATLRTVGDLRQPPFSPWQPHYDLLDWLALFFGFQSSNVRNQREHIVFHLSKAQMRLSLPPDNIDTLNPFVLRRFCHTLLKNYSNYLNLKSNTWSTLRFLAIVIRCWNAVQFGFKGD
ncbi:Callose synthase 12 [Forsythia ovata]|uniref:Callose synthase 12 n=1 Tax=Forsythia ovata TaxID=205694 RepID=A0ABD1P504_9LAMI